MKRAAVAGLTILLGGCGALPDLLSKRIESFSHFVRRQIAATSEMTDPIALENIKFIEDARDDSFDRVLETAAAQDAAPNAPDSQDPS